MTTEITLIIITAFVTLISNIIINNKNRKANKEDIKTITQSVEEVKLQFTKANNENKAKLDLLYSAKRDAFNEQKKAMLEFWEEHFTMIRLCDPSRYEIDGFRMDDFRTLQKKIEEQEDRCEIANARLNFHTFDKYLISLSEEIFEKTILNSIEFLKYLDRIEPHLEQLRPLLESSKHTEYFEHSNMLDELYKEYKEKLKIEEFDDYLKRFKNACSLILKKEFKI
jgi:hypothetical protein